MDDIRYTRFYQEVFQEGFEEGLREASYERILIRLLTHRFGPLHEAQVDQIQALSLAQLEQLTDVMLDLASLEALEAWLQEHSAEVR